MSGMAASAAAQPKRRKFEAPHVPDHDVIKRIGEGSCGRVWLARTDVCVSSGRPLARSELRFHIPLNSV
jgi:hypothetical protein